MTQQEHFDRSVAVLVKAYINSELQHGSCTACAVGNLIAAGAGYKYKSGRTWLDKQGQSVDAMSWYEATADVAKGNLCPEATTEVAQKLVSVTGYDLRQITQIEAAFEFRNLGRPELHKTYELDMDSRQYVGLMAVVDVLAEIHGIDLTTSTAAKALFVKVAA